MRASVVSECAFTQEGEARAWEEVEALRAQVTEYEKSTEALAQASRGAKEAQQVRRFGVRFGVCMLTAQLTQAHSAHISTAIN